MRRFIQELREFFEDREEILEDYLYPEDEWEPNLVAEWYPHPPPDIQNKLFRRFRGEYLTGLVDIRKHPWKVVMLREGWKPDYDKDETLADVPGFVFASEVVTLGNIHAEGMTVHADEAITFRDVSDDDLLLGILAFIDRGPLDQCTLIYTMGVGAGLPVRPWGGGEIHIHFGPHGMFTV